MSKFQIFQIVRKRQLDIACYMRGFDTDQLEIVVSCVLHCYNG